MYEQMSYVCFSAKKGLILTGRKKIDTRLSYNMRKEIMIIGYVLFKM